MLPEKINYKQISHINKNKIFDFKIILFSLIFVLASCDENIKQAKTLSRFIASESISKVDGNDSLSDSVKEYLNEEQNSSNNVLFNEKYSLSAKESVYSPALKPKFPIPYYLIPEEDAAFVAADSFDPRIADQLVMRISGKRHYKFFIHPESEIYYDFLRRSYNYVGPDLSEFFASPTSDIRTLVVWNKNGNERKAFIAKVSLGENVDSKNNHLVTKNEIERVISNQKVLNQIGYKNLKKIDFKFFPEPAGFTINKNKPGTQVNLGGQIIIEIPDDITDGINNIYSFSVLMNTNKKTTPLIMEVIKQSGLSSYDFLQIYMIDSYLKMFEEMSFQNGIIFEPNFQSLALETTKEMKPTGKWILKELNGLWPDVLTMIKNQGPVNIFMETASVTKYQLRAGSAKYISSYAVYYKRKVFTNMLTTIAKYDLSLTSDQLTSLQDSLDQKYLKMVNSYSGLKLNVTPTLTDYKEVEETVLNNKIFDDKIEKKEIKNTENLKKFIENKKEKNEWIEFSTSKEKSQYYLTNYGLYEISNKKIVALGLFTQHQLEEYNSNDKMLSNFNIVELEAQEKTSCTGIINDFFLRAKK